MAERRWRVVLLMVATLLVYLVSPDSLPGTEGPPPSAYEGVVSDGVTAMPSAGSEQDAPPVLLMTSAPVVADPAGRPAVQPFDCLRPDPDTLQILRC